MVNRKVWSDNRTCSDARPPPGILMSVIRICHQRAVEPLDVLLDVRCPPRCRACRSSSRRRYKVSNAETRLKKPGAEGGRPPVERAITPAFALAIEKPRQRP